MNIVSGQLALLLLINDDRNWDRFPVGFSDLSSFHYFLCASVCLSARKPENHNDRKLV